MSRGLSMAVLQMVGLRMAGRRTVSAKEAVYQSMKSTADGRRLTAGRVPGGGGAYDPALSPAAISASMISRARRLGTRQISQRISTHSVRNGGPSGVIGEAKVSR